MSYPDVYLLRHGQTIWNSEGRMQGQQDSPLTALGLTQAKHQNAILHRLDLNPVPLLFCSPLGRTRQTAKLALDGITGTVTFDPRIQELGVGSWEGQLREDVIAAHPDIFDRDLTVLERFCRNPDGERYEDAMARAQSFLDDLPGPAIIVSHGILISLLRGLLCGLDFDGIAALDHPQGKVIAVSGGVETLHR